MPDQYSPAILHISTASSWRGGEQQLAYLFEELQQLGVRQSILCQKDSAMHQHCEKNGWHYNVAPKAASIDLRFARHVARTFRKGNFELVHTHDSHAHSFAIMAVKFFNAKLPIVVSRRVDFPINSKGKYNHAQVRKIVCVSDAIKRITGADITDKSKLTTVHSGIDLSRFAGKSDQGILRNEFSIPTDVPLIGNVSALAPHKDYFTFIDTVKELVDRGTKARFLAIGGGDMEDELKRYAQDKDVSKHLIFTGFRRDIPLILPELDVFLITSETEGLGTSILDALACKVPVVATEAGGIPEIIRNEETGLLAPVKDSQKLADAVGRLLNGPALQQQLIAGGSAHLQHFTKEATAAKTLAVYREVIKKD